MTSGPRRSLRSNDAELDQFGEVGKRPRQPVYLVDDDDVDLAGADVRQQPLEVRPVGRSTE
jgi:hypothetical protein